VVAAEYYLKAALGWHSKVPKCEPNGLYAPSGYSERILGASNRTWLANRARVSLFWQSTRPLQEIGGYQPLLPRNRLIFQAISL